MSRHKPAPSGRRGTRLPVATGAPPPCDTPDTCGCGLRELWPYPGETDEQFKARLRAAYYWTGPLGRDLPIPTETTP